MVDNLAASTEHVRAAKLVFLRVEMKAGRLEILKVDQLGSHLEYERVEMMVCY